MDKFPKGFGSNYLSQTQNNNRDDIDEDDNRSDIEKKIEATKGATKETIKHATKEVIKKSAVAAGKVAIKAIGSALSALLSWVAPILAPVLIIIICIFLILVPTSYAYMHFVGAFDDIKNSFLQFNTSVSNAFVDWFKSGDEALDDKAENYEQYILKRFKDLNNKLIEGKIEGADAADMKDLAVFWVYGKIYNDYFKPSTAEVFLSILGQNEESKAPILKPLDDTVNNIYTPILGSNIEDSRKQTHGDSINLYDIAAFDYVAGSLFDLMDLDLEIALNELINEHKDEIDKAEKEAKLAIYQKYGGKLIYQWGYHIYKLTNAWGVDSALEDKGIAVPSVLQKNKNKANALYNFLMEAQGYSSSKEIAYLREKLLKLEQKNYSDGYSEEVLGKAIFTKVKDYKKISSVSQELENMYLSYILSLATKEADIQDLQKTVKQVLKQNPFKAYVTDVSKDMKQELKDAHVDIVKEFTQEDIEAKLEKMVKDLKLSRTQQAAFTYKKYLTELDVSTSVEYYSVNLKSDLFVNIGKIADYTNGNPSASKYIVKKAKGKSPSANTLFKNNISGIEEIKNSFIIDSQDNPVVSAIDTSSGVDYFQGNINKFISAINGKLSDNLQSLEKYKLLYEAMYSSNGGDYKNTEEYKETLAEIEAIYWEEIDGIINNFTSNAWFLFYNTGSIGKLDNNNLSTFKSDVANRRTTSYIWDRLTNTSHSNVKANDDVHSQSTTRAAFQAFYTDVLGYSNNGEYFGLFSPTFVNIYNDYDAYLDIFTRNACTINQFRSASTYKDKGKAQKNDLLKKIIEFIDSEIANIKSLQEQLLALENANPKESSAFTKANLASFTKPGDNGQGNNGLVEGPYSDGVNTLNIMKFKYTQEEAVKKTIQKHYGDILKLYKSSGSSGNKGTVDLSLDISEFLSGLNLADFQIEFFQKVAPLAMADYYESGILPSITLSQAIIESGWAGLNPGTYDYLANEANNIFGIKAYYWSGPVYPFNAKGEPESPGYRKYDSWEECVRDHGKFLTVGTYITAGILEAEDCWGQMDALVAGGYCESGDYPAQLTECINLYGLELYDVKVKGSSGIGNNTDSDDGFSYHKDGALVLWREYYTNNLTFSNLDKWASKTFNVMNKPSLEILDDNKLFSTHIINAINNLDSTLASELVTVGITPGELKNIVAATLNAGLYTPKDSDKFALAPGFKVTMPTKKNADAIVKAIAKEYINIYKKLGSKDKGFAIYLYVVDDRDLAYLEIQNETSTFAEFVKKVSSSESESFTNINPNFVKVAQIISGDINVDVKDFYKLMNMSNNTAGGSSNSTISNPVDLFYQDWLDAKYTMHDMFNMMNEEMDNKYDRLPTYEEVFNNMGNLNQGSNIEGILTIEGPNGIYYSFTITKKFLTNNVDESLSLSSPQYIVIHDTGNTSLSADANEIYNTMNSSGATETMHYIVDSKGAYHTIKDNLMANHINDSATSTGGTRPEITNSNSFGVQFTVNASGDKKKTFWHTVAITKYLMEKYTITDYNNVVLHNDVTGANDSQYMLAKDKEKWIEFKDALQNSTIKFEQYTNGITANDIALAAVAKALEQLGKPYGWGDTGPDSFDCSGLVQYAYANNSVQPVSIPRTTYDQVKVGRLIFDKYKGGTFSLGELLPGDLIFRGGSSPTHVLMYIGNGEAVHAPQTGDVVKITSHFGDVTHVVRIVEGVSNGGGLQFFSQTDSRWANFTYYRPGKTIRGSGCGVTSMAMIINAFDVDKSAFDTNKDGIVTPDEMATYAMKIHAYVEGQGTDASVLTPAVAKASGLTYYSYTNSIPELKDHLRKGRLALGSYSKGLWTSEGHLIAVVGIDSSGRAIVYDPAIPTLDGSATAAGQPPRYNGPQTDTNLESGLNRFYIIGK